MEAAGCKPLHLGKGRGGEKWLDEVWPVFLAARSARRCVTEEMWARYEALGIDDLAEIELWNQTSAALRRATRPYKRPTIFKEKQ